MTTIFAISDTHGCSLPESWTENIDNSKPDAIIHLGDFSDFGKMAEMFFESCKPMGLPIYFISGNHESRMLCKDMLTDCARKKLDIICLDYTWMIVGDILLVGLGGYDMFTKSRKLNILRFNRQLREAGMVGSTRLSVLLTHEPPWPWYHHGQAGGDMNITELLRELPFDLVLTGHMHEQDYKIQKNEIPVPTINPGLRGVCIKFDCTHEAWYILK